jgi:FMN-dependent NADH-azoreductase
LKLPVGVSIAGKSFRYTENGPEGLLKGKKAFIASVAASIRPARRAAAFEHHESYLTGVLAFLGIKDVTIVRAEGVAISPEAREAALAKAHTEISAIADHLRFTDHVSAARPSLSVIHTY